VATIQAARRGQRCGPGKCGLVVVEALPVLRQEPGNVYQRDGADEVVTRHPGALERVPELARDADAGCARPQDDGPLPRQRDAGDP
jgi:hypothetical protein